MRCGPSPHFSPVEDNCPSCLQIIIKITRSIRTGRMLMPNMGLPNMALMAVLSRYSWGKASAGPDPIMISHAGCFVTAVTAVQL